MTAPHENGPLDTVQNMTQTTCAKCDREAESQWRIRLEEGSETMGEETSYRLCRGCWNALRARFSGSGAER